MNITEAVKKYGSEVAGFVVAAEAEPWTIHAATVIATRQNGAVAPDAVADQLGSAGWQELDDVRGQWPDAVSAYQATTVWLRLWTPIQADIFSMATYPMILLKKKSL